MEHIYKPTVVGRILAILAVPLLVGFGFTRSLHGSLNDSFKNPVVPIVLVAIILAVGIAILAIVKEEVRVSDNGIERRTLFGTRRIPASEIGGWRVRWHSTKGGPYYTLDVCPKERTSYKPITISRYIKIDGDFKSWVMKFPSLTTDGGMMGSLMSSPRIAEKAKDPKFAAEMKVLAGTQLDISPEKMVENFFAQWGL